jgi:putative oxidoreductase
MGIVHRLNRMAHANHHLVFLMLRIALGLLLLFKGISFLSNAEALESLIRNSRFKAGTTFLVTYITFAHLFGGTFIIIGLLTRWVVLLQIPILLGAVIFFSRPSDVFSIGSEFWLSLLVLLLLLFFAFEGGGLISMDRFRKKNLL